MIIPSSTAVEEREFSLMANIDSKKRNRLAERNTDALMRICHTDKDLDGDDLNSVVDNFKGLRKRKPHM
jgi:hypothetical protein